MYMKEKDWEGGRERERDRETHVFCLLSDYDKKVVIYRWSFVLRHARHRCQENDDAI